MSDINKPQQLQEEENTLKDQLNYYLIRWKWFVLGLLITISGAYFYLKYSKPVYLSTATILVKDDSRGGGLSEAAILEDLGNVPSFSSVNLEDEVAILTSKNLMGAVVDKLGLTKEYIVEGNIKESELYKRSPIELKYIGTDSLNAKGYGVSLNLEIISGDSFKVKKVSNDKFEEARFGEVLNLGFGKFVVVPSATIGAIEKRWYNTDFIINLKPRFSAISSYQGKLIVDNGGRRSSALNVSMQDFVSEKSEDIINNLIDQFNKDAISDKNLISENTFRFIAERLEIIAEELDSVEKNIEQFKSSNKLTDISSESQIFIEENQRIQQQTIDIETQLELSKTIIEYLQDPNRSSSLLPTNLGFDETGIASSIQEYNNLILERDRQLQYGTALNPVVVTLNNQIEEIKTIILQGLQNSRQNLQIRLREIRGQQNRIDSQISSVPLQEKIFRDISRQQNIKEELYLYLLRKREETAISLAITVPVAKVIDRAYTNRNPVFPKPKILYLAAIALGIVLPFLFLYIRRFLDTKIHNKGDVEKILKQIPVLGEIPKIDSKESETIKNNDRSVLAEAFRILRTNLSYFVKAIEGQDKKVIYVTSTVKGEGKTFVAFNLGLTLSSTDKRVLVIGADIRNPQLHRYIDKPEASKGLSEYLYDEKINVSSVIDTYSINNKELDILLSGRIPPNPAELLMRKRFQDLIESVKDNYDYVIVDTAPTMLVTDTLLISQYADFTVYVCRAEYTEKNLLNFPKELKQEQKLRNMAMVVNGVNISNYGYGNKYGYGYTYGVEVEPWYKRFFKALGFK